MRSSCGDPAKILRRCCGDAAKMRWISPGFSIDIEALWAKRELYKKLINNLSTIFLRKIGLL
jgi:hypothetical protein